MTHHVTPPKQAHYISKHGKPSIIVTSDEWERRWKIYIHVFLITLGITVGAVEVVLAVSPVVATLSAGVMPGAFQEVFDYLNRY